MNIGIISYSQTGRNNKMAELVSDKLGYKHIKITETKQRKMMTVAWDLLLNRTPKTKPDTKVLDEFDLVIFFAPVWMGMPATPLKQYLKYVKKTGLKYGFISLSGGADESNPKLKDSIIKKTGSELKVFLDMHVADLIKDKKPERADTQSYKVSDEEYEMLCRKAVAIIKKAVEK